MRKAVRRAGPTVRQLNAILLGLPSTILWLTSARPKEFALDGTKLSTIGQRFERSRFGELVISVMVVLILTIGVVWSLPDAEIKRRLGPVLQPLAVATGLEQDWRMYAPEPLARMEFVEVRVTMTDGLQRVWTTPGGDRVVGPFVWYHWQKLKENLVRVPEIRAGLAHWVIRRVTGSSEHASRVRMILRSESLPAPGTDSPGAVGEEILYDEKLTGGQ
jgi:hypothetical protein